MKIQPNPIFLAVLFALGPLGGQVVGPSPIWKGFPNYLDPETSNRVYQISAEHGLNRTFYYHQARFQSADWVVYENLPPKPTGSFTYK